LRKLRDKGKTAYCFIESEAPIKNAGDLNANPEESMKASESISDWKISSCGSRWCLWLRKNLILIGEQKETESLYLIFKEFYPSTDSFIASLKWA